jgi:hypothetical protein
MLECFFHTFSSGVAAMLLAGCYFQLWKNLEKDNWLMAMRNQIAATTACAQEFMRP